VGSSITFRLHQAPEVARLASPFRIHCAHADVEPGQRLRQVVTGDLSGVLESLLRKEPERAATRVTLTGTFGSPIRCSTRWATSPNASTVTTTTAS
jgi:hypothetical protein